MKKMFYLGLLLFASCLGKREKNDAVQMQLVGEVQSVRIESFKAEEKFGTVERGNATDAENYFVLFDDNGNQRERIFYDSKGKSLHKYTYTYNEAKQRVEVNLFKENQTLSHKFLYKYDERGNRIEIADYTADGKLFMLEKQTFDTNNFAISRISYNADGKMLGERKMLRSKDGKLQEEAVYGSTGELKRRVVYSYNSSGNPIKEEHYVKNNTLKHTKTFVYEFDYKGNWTKRIDYQNQRPIAVVIRTIEYATKGVQNKPKAQSELAQLPIESDLKETRNKENMQQADKVRHQPYQKMDDGYYNFHENENLIQFAQRIMPKFEKRIELLKNNLTSTPSQENDRLYSSFLKETNVLLESLNDKLYEGFNPNGANELNAILAPYSLQLIMADGDYIELNENFYTELFAGKLTPESNDFMHLVKISDYLYADGAVMLSLKDFGEYIYKLESFVTSYPTSRKSFNLNFANNREKLAFDLRVYLLGELDNHRLVVWEFNNKKLTEEAIFEFRRYAKAHPTSKVTELIYILLDNPSMNREQLILMVEREINAWLK